MAAGVGGLMDYVTAQTPWDVEHNVMCSLLRNGHPDARLTSMGADGGVDVRAQGLVVQVKAEWGKPIGREVIQQIAGIAAVESARAAVFSWSGFTPQAMEWAGDARVALFQIADRDGRVVRLNSAADLIGPRVGDDSEPRFTVDVPDLSTHARQHISNFIDTAGPTSHGAMHLVGRSATCEAVAMAVARHLGAGVRLTSSASLPRESDLASIVAQMGEGEVLFVDGLNNFPIERQRFLVDSHADRRMTVVVGKGSSATAIPLELAPHLLVTGSRTPPVGVTSSLYVY
jgi:hypothetical protein